MSPGFNGNATTSFLWDSYFSLPDFGFAGSPTAKFAHVRTGGDSGCPTIIPGAGGTWGMVGQESNGSPSKDGYDILIGLLDARAVENAVLVAPTGYVTTEIIDPTA